MVGEVFFQVGPFLGGHVAREGFLQGRDFVVRLLHARRGQAGPVQGQLLGPVPGLCVLVIVRLTHAPRRVDQDYHVGPALALEQQPNLRQEDDER